MPKIIENLKERLLEETKRQIWERGYQEVTIRSIAKGCDVGIGTVYNYFTSKEALIAAYLLEDWNVCLQAIWESAELAQEPQPVLLCIHRQLLGFAQRHESIFKTEAAAVGFARSHSRYHGMLRTQLAEPLRQFCDSDFQARFAAESLLTWTVDGESFDRIYDVLKKLF